MDDFTAILSKFGWSGVLAYGAIYYGRIWWNIVKGKHISCKDLEIRIVKLEIENKNMNDLIPIYNQHLKDATGRVIDLETVKQDNKLNNEFMKENIKEMKDDIKSLFKLVSDMKNMMIQRGN